LTEELGEDGDTAEAAVRVLVEQGALDLRLNHACRNAAGSSPSGRRASRRRFGLVVARASSGRGRTGVGPTLHWRCTGGQPRKAAEDSASVGEMESGEAERKADHVFRLAVASGLMDR
jgi:hypothetical protein